MYFSTKIVHALTDIEEDNSKANLGANATLIFKRSETLITNQLVLILRYKDASTDLKDALSTKSKNK